MKLNIELYLKVDFVGTRVGQRNLIYYKAILYRILNSMGWALWGKQTHMDIPVF